MKTFRVFTAAYILGVSFFVARLFGDNRKFGWVEFVTLAFLFVLYIALLFLFWKKWKW